MSISKANLYFYAAALAGVLTVTTFAYSAVLVPVWNWVSELPVKMKSSFPASSANTQNSPVRDYQPSQSYTTISEDQQPVAQKDAAKPANCGKIIKQIKAGKAVSMPNECQEAYRIIKDQEQAKLDREREKEEYRQRELDREARERENQQRLEFERQREIEKRQQEEERARAASEERERQRQEAEDRRQRQQDAADRREAKREADRRERESERQTQKRNDALIKLGNDIRKKIFKRN